MAAHSAAASIPPVPPDQPPGAWATWLREIAQAVNLLGARVNDPPSVDDVAEIKTVQGTVTTVLGSYDDGAATEGYVGTTSPGHSFSVYVGNELALGFASDLSAVFAGPVTQKPLASATPASNGELVVQATSDTQLTFKLKGSDGVVRSGNLTLV